MNGAVYDVAVRAAETESRAYTFRPEAPVPASCMNGPAVSLMSISMSSPALIDAPAQRRMHVHVRERRGVDEDGMRGGAEIRAEVVSRLAVLQDGDVHALRSVCRQRRRLSVTVYGPAATRRRAEALERRAAMLPRRPVALDREAKDLLADAVRRRVGVDVVAMIRLFGEGLPKTSARRIECRVQVRERREVVAHDDQVHQLLHVDVVVEDRRLAVELKLANRQRRGQSGGMFGPKLRDDLRRAAEQREDAGLLDRAGRRARDADAADRGQRSGKEHCRSVGGA